MPIWPRNLMCVLVMVFPEKKPLDGLKKERGVGKRNVDQGKTTFLKCDLVCQWEKIRMTAG